MKFGALVFGFSFIIIKVSCDTKFDCLKESIDCGCGLNSVLFKSNEPSDKFEEAIPNSWPMILSLQYDCHRENNSATHCCTGTIVSESLVLTSAQCVEKITSSQLSSGGVTVHGINLNRLNSKKIVRRVDQIHIHPSKSTSSSEISHDLALLHLEEPFDFISNPQLSPTCYRTNVESFSRQEKLLISDSGPLAVVRWNEALNEQKNLLWSIQQKWIHPIDFHNEDCQSIVKRSDMYLCTSTNGNDQNQNLPVFQWINNRWLQVGMTASFNSNEVHINKLNIVTKLVYYEKWLHSISMKYKNSHIKGSNPMLPPGSLNKRYPVHYKCFRKTAMCGCGFEEVRLNSAEISSGEEATYHSWSMVVSIRINESRQHICSGSILTDFHILTAADCVDSLPLRPIGLTVIAAIHELSEGGVDIFEVDEIIKHPNWNPDSRDYLNNLAILRLSTSLEIDSNPFMKRSCVPYNIPSTSAVDYPRTNASLATVGWGSMLPYPNISEVMQQSEVFAVDSHHPNCNLSLNRRNLQFCAGLYGGARDSCAGDSGGPIFEWKGKSWLQVGVTSYRGNCKNDSGPGLYTRLAPYNEWLRGVTRESLTTTMNTLVTNPPVTYHCDPSLTCGCSYTDVQLPPSARIVGGYDAVPHSWSMVVSLRRLGNNEHFCGGTIINDYFILTAAHCFIRRPLEAPTGVFVASGSHRQSDFTDTPNEVERVYMHHEWVPGPLGNWNDVALLRLSRPLNISNNRFITRTCLQRVNRSTSMSKYPTPGTRLAAVGWGALEDYSSHTPDNLQQVELLVLSKDYEPCDKSIKDKARQFCAGIPEIGGKDTCRGDSGGPILEWRGNRWEQVGIVSYGLTCADPRTPTVLSQVANYVDWIEQIIRESTLTTPISTTTTTTTTTLTTTTTTSSSNSRFWCCYFSILTIFIVLLA